MKTDPQPPNATDESSRRAMLQWLIDRNGGMNAVERNTGVSRMQLRRLVKGVVQTKKGPKETSLLTAEPETIERLLSAFSLTDAKAWELFGIPSELRQSRWRTSRPYPVGSGTAVDVDNVRHMRLDQPLGGDLHAPQGLYVQVAELSEAARPDELLVVELGGRLYVLREAAVPQGSRVEGRFAGLIL